MEIPPEVVAAKEALEGPLLQSGPDKEGRP
jgi:hypothetical protein